jgi:hypothetical protein
VTLVFVAVGGTGVFVGRLVAVGAGATMIVTI